MTEQDIYEEKLKGRESTNIASIINSMIDGINGFISQKDIEQKTRLNSQNVRGMLEGEALNVHLEDIYGFKNRVLDSAIRYKRLYAKSEDGQGIDDIIKLAHAFVLNLKQETDAQHPDKLKQLGGSEFK